MPSDLLAGISLPPDHFKPPFFEVWLRLSSQSCPGPSSLFFWPGERNMCYVLVWHSQHKIIINKFGFRFKITLHNYIVQIKIINLSILGDIATFIRLYGPFHLLILTSSSIEELSAFSKIAMLLIWTGQKVLKISLKKLLSSLKTFECLILWCTMQ